MPPLPSLINEQDIAFPLRLSVDPDVGLYVVKVFIEIYKYYYTNNIVSFKYVAKIKQLHKFAKIFQYFFKKTPNFFIRGFKMLFNSELYLYFFFT
jgi:hypothetical protein